ncbi:unnamed protein product [Rotaria socialis]|uniref:Uncharacterized protein n=1 Tax=Rotaria socialis TaxID=392032 RepID=A0A818DVE4_9BILA|nr:unnamed protein product [Rotaria socialis]CAF4651355.1 unnamed protein product [Rotaria socialis]
MLRLYAVILLYSLTIIPYGVDSFFNESVGNMTVARNISCYSISDSTASNNFQFCAIRIYRSQTAASNISSTVYNGLRYMNTFRRLTEKACNVTVARSLADTGAWICDGTLPYETYTSMDLCVCATDNCNENLTSCQNSANNSTDMLGSAEFMPNLTLIISCNDTSNDNYTCSMHPFINIPLCQDYARKNSVLCAITVSGTTTTQESLIDESYETYLSDKVYQIKTVVNLVSVDSYNETQSSVYFNYMTPAAMPFADCACTSFFCNQNITTCNLQTPLEVETTTTTTTTTTATTATTTTTTATATTITTTTTGGTTITDTTATTTTTTTTTAGTSTTQNAATTTTGASTTQNATTTTTGTSTTQNVTTTTTTGPGGEKGLGSAATAGLACGIIFSALIFTGEILFFKFVYSGGLGIILLEDQQLMQHEHS